MFQNKSNCRHKAIEEIQSQVSDLSYRMLTTHLGTVYVLFIKQLTDRPMLSEYIVKPLMEYLSGKNKLSADELASQVIYVDDCSTERETTKIADYLLNGNTVILLSWDAAYLVANIKKIESKSIESPELTYTLRGPRDSFTECLDTNLSLIRYRIKDTNLKIQIIQLGPRTKANVAVAYIENAADKNIVQDILQRITNLKPNDIIESGKLQSLLLNNRQTLFPQMGLIERSDMACNAILHGKVVVVTEGSGIALAAPQTFSDFLRSGDDWYDNRYLALFLMVIRYIALFTSFILGSLYIAIVSFHNDTLPSEYILILAMLRSNVPFNPVTGVFILEVLLEILREALLRIPKKIGPAIGIAGTIIIGQAAIASGIFSPLLLILVSTSLLASFAMPDYTITNPFRIYKFLMMILSSIFGLIGFTLGLCFILTNIVSANSFGVAFAAPVAPFKLKAFISKILKP